MAGTKELETGYIVYEKEAKQRMAELEKALLEVGDHPHAVEVLQEGTDRLQIARILAMKGCYCRCAPESPAIG